MTNRLKNIIINIFGAMIAFVIFSFHEFLNWIVTTNDNYLFFLLPWWGWGIVGVVAFEIVYFFIHFRR